MKVFTLKQEPRKKPVKVLDYKTGLTTKLSLKNWFCLGIGAGPEEGVQGTGME